MFSLLGFRCWPTNFDSSCTDFAWNAVGSVLKGKASTAPVTRGTQPTWRVGLFYSATHAIVENIKCVIFHDSGAHSIRETVGFFLLNVTVAGILVTVFQEGGRASRMGTDFKSNFPVVMVFSIL